MGDESNSDTDEEGVVRPEELDFTRDRRVVRLDDDTYVVATAGNDAPSVPDGVEEDESIAAADESTASEVPDEVADETADDSTSNDGDAVDTPADEPGETSRSAARRQLFEYADSRAERHGFVAVGSFDGTVEGTEAFGEDLAAVFGELVQWYAGNVGTDTPPPEVLGILLLAGGVPVEYPAAAFEAAVDAYGVSPDDSVRDLLAAVRGSGFRIPPASE